MQSICHKRLPISGTNLLRNLRSCQSLIKTVLFGNNADHNSGFPDVPSNECHRFFASYVQHHKANVCDECSFKLTKALLVTKLSRLEFEQHRHCNLNKVELERMIRNRGSDYEALLHFHHIHKNFEQKIARSFIEFGVDVQLVNRLTLSRDHIKWADMLVPIGGDGTFLMAAGRASPLFSDLCKSRPVVGFNSDPNRSEGRLMLPKEYSHDPKEAVRKIKNSDFKWIHRSRIKVTLLGQNGDLSQAIDLHEQNFTPMSPIDLPAQPLNEFDARKYDSKMKKVLPYLALNEVFIGETLSARVSHLQITKDNEVTTTKTKSSGLCVSTGTGSTSWLTSINRLSVKNVEKLLAIVSDRNGGNRLIKNIDPKTICDEYNHQLIFPPDDPRLCYSIREQICVGVWPNPKGFQSRGFARTLLIKSRCYDASLVIDGSIAYPFNDGAKALLEVHPEDALLTISINEV